MADLRKRKAMDLTVWDRVVNAVHEFARKGDRSILQRVKDAIKKLFEISDKDKMDKAINDIMDDFNETIDDISMNEIEVDGFGYKNQATGREKPKIKFYRAIQVIDGKLFLLWLHRRVTSEEEDTHFREDRGLQYSKTDTKDVKKGRIIPENVDKSVSSQIEKKFDDRVDELTKGLSNEDKAEFNRHLDYYTSVFSRYKASEITYILNGLENDVRFWERSLGNGENASRAHLVQLKTAELRAAETAARREMDYREVRVKALADGYGLRRGAKASFADISRLFEATNQGKEEGARKLFEKACDIAKRLGVEFGGKDEGARAGNIGEATPEREINIFIDTLTRTYTKPNEAANTILHELIHQATMNVCHPSS